MGITDLMAALALVLVIEGALYALFPGGVKRMMVEVLTWREATLRGVGAAAVAAGVGLAWWVWG